MENYSTPKETARVEWMNSDFLKLHPGPPIHVFKDARDEHYHTHPFDFVTHIIDGGYREEVLVQLPDKSWQVQLFDRTPGTSHRMSANTPHRLTGLLNGTCITRCEYGLPVQVPGFVRFTQSGQLEHRYHDKSEWTPFNP